MNPFAWLMEIFLQGTGTEKFLNSLTSGSRLQPFTCENWWLQNGSAAVHSKLVYALLMWALATQNGSNPVLRVLISVHQAPDQLWAGCVAGPGCFTGHLMGTE